MLIEIDPTKKLTKNDLIAEIKSNILETIEAVNQAHWDEDYKAAILSDKMLIRKLNRRIVEAGLSGENVTILENGPAGCFAINLD
jgi:hypothetical protein